MRRIFLLMLIFATLGVFSGELEDFEKGIWESDEPDNDSDYDSDYDSDSDSSSNECLEGLCSVGCEVCASEVGQQCFIITADLITSAGIISYDIATEGGEHKKRDNGSLLLPIVRYDCNMSYIVNKENVFSINQRLEVGFGPIAIATNFNQYKEENITNDMMEVIDGSIIYRMSFNRNLEIGLSLGASILSGEYKGNKTGFKLGHPIRYIVNKNLGLELRPSYILLENTTLFDFDASVFWGIKYFGFNLGYKVYGNDKYYMHGPYLGVRALY